MPSKKRSPQQRRLGATRASRPYKEILNELADWEFHELLQQHSLKELKALKEKFEAHRSQLIRALEEKEKKGEM